MYYDFLFIYIFIPFTKITYYPQVYQLTIKVHRLPFQHNSLWFCAFWDSTNLSLFFLIQKRDGMGRLKLAITAFKSHEDTFLSSYLMWGTVVQDYKGKSPDSPSKLLSLKTAKKRKWHMSCWDNLISSYSQYTWIIFESRKKVN